MRYFGFLPVLAGIITNDPCDATAEMTPVQLQARAHSHLDSSDRNIQQEGSPATLVLHFNPIHYDARPRATMSFIKNGQRIGFSLMFDTGSADSLILEFKGTPEERDAIGLSPPAYMPIDEIDHSLEPVFRPAKRGEGYLNVGYVEGEVRNIYFGTANDLRPVESNGRINEFAVLYSGGNFFGYEIEIELTKRITDPAIGIGLLGAGRMSHLAQSARIFSFMGPPIDYTGPATRSAGTLLIGERDESVLNSNCLDGQELRFFPTRTEISKVHWVVGGSLTMKDKSGREFATTDINWGLDTGAHSVFVTTGMKLAIKQAMLENGANLISDSPGKYPMYKDCPSAGVMPTFTFDLGTGTQAVPVVLTAKDYIRTYTGEYSGYCSLEVSDSTPNQSVRLIGIQVLSKLFTVFDAENDRLGFCIKRL